jgi:5'-nucleotidase
MNRPLIFITNDDGVNARGLQTVVEVARRFGRVIVIAPEVTQSGMSHAITMYKPLMLRTVEKSDDLTIYACSGTPVDCVKMGYDYLFSSERPALNISGINHGSNSAINVLYSGTMGAAIEASFYGSPSVGLSLDDHSSNADFDASALFAEKLMGDILSAKINEPLCLNVNIPVGRPEQIRGHRVCRQNKGYWKEEFFCRQDPRGKDYFWLTGSFFNVEPDATDTDEWALANGYISVVPIQVDMTNYRQIETMRSIIK